MDNIFNDELEAAKQKLAEAIGAQPSHVPLGQRHNALMSYIKRALERDVDALCDDPHGVFAIGSEYASTPSEIVAHVELLYWLHKLTGQDLSEAIVKRASNSEFTRLMELILEARRSVWAAEKEIQKRSDDNV